jgi:hypothetical protein
MVRSQPKYLHVQLSFCCKCTTASTYSEDDTIEIWNPEFAEDPFLGHVLARRILPPHTVARIKRYLCRNEGITNYTHTSLFTDLACLNPLEDSELVDITNLIGVSNAPGGLLALIATESSEPPKATVVIAASPQLVPPSSASSLPQSADDNWHCSYDCQLLALHDCGSSYCDFWTLSDDNFPR